MFKKIWKRYRFLFFLLVAGMGLVLGAEWATETDSFRLFAEPEGVIISQKGELFTYGAEETETMRVLLRGVRGYFQQGNPLRLEVTPVGKVLRGQNYEILRPSGHIIRGRFGDATVLFLDEISDEEKEALLHSPTRWDADWWVLKQNMAPDLLPLPRTGILLLGEREPSKDLKTFAIKQQLPLVFVQSVGGVVARYEEDGKWNLRVRQP